MPFQTKKNLHSTQYNAHSFISTIFTEHFFPMVLTFAYFCLDWVLGCPLLGKCYEYKKYNGDWYHMAGDVMIFPSKSRSLTMLGECGGMLLNVTGVCVCSSNVRGVCVCAPPMFGKCVGTMLPQC